MSEEKKQFIFYYTIESSVIIPRLFPDLETNKQKIIFFRELEVEHPAAKMVILGSQMQESEVGDATNFVIILAGQLLKEAEDLIRSNIFFFTRDWETAVRHPLNLDFM